MGLLMLRLYIYRSENLLHEKLCIKFNNLFVPFEPPQLIDTSLTAFAFSMFKHENAF